MKNTDITLEKRMKIVMGAFAILVSFLIYHLAILMSVAPTFLDAQIAYAPNQIHIDPFIPEWSCRDFKLGDTIDQFDNCFDYFLKEGRLSPAYPPKKMYQPYTIEKLPNSLLRSHF